MFYHWYALEANFKRGFTIFALLPRKTLFRKSQDGLKIATLVMQSFQSLTDRVALTVRKYSRIALGKTSEEDLGTMSKNNLRG